MMVDLCKEYDFYKVLVLWQIWTIWAFAFLVFKLGIMVNNTQLRSLTSVWMAVTFLYGHSFAKNLKLTTCFLAVLLVKLDESYFAPVVCWGIETNSGFVCLFVFSMIISQEKESKEGDFIFIKVFKKGGRKDVGVFQLVWSDSFKLGMKVNITELFIVAYFDLHWRSKEFEKV